MSEISENEIKSMTKEQNYMRGYENGKSDVLDKIRAEIEQNAYPIVHGFNNHEKGMTLYGILKVIDKYRGESDCRECKAEHDCYECEKYEESEG